MSLSLSLLTHGWHRRIKKIVQQVPLTPVAGQEVLAKSLELPLPSEVTAILGIHQSDVIIRSGLTAALADIRHNPWLLDYVFASLPQDPLTWKEYGERDIVQVKNWFLNTHLPVLITPVMDEAKLPCITISLVDSSEVIPETTLGDVNYDAFESSGRTWPALTEVFTPKSYSPTTGLVTLNSLPDTVYLAEGMFIVDRVGRDHEILEVLSDLSFKIKAGTVADFRGSVLKSHKPSWITSVESASFRETYRIGLHVPATAAQLVWMHSIVVFALLRYKEALLEARGFERSTFQSSDFIRNQQSDTEFIFTRNINITGYVRQYWPKIVAPVIDGVRMDGIRVSGQNADVQVSKTGQNPDDLLWIGNLDSISVKKK